MSEYESRINRVIDFVSSHLDAKLPLEQLAKIANFSPYHFHRIFRAPNSSTDRGFQGVPSIARRDDDNYLQ